MKNLSQTTPNTIIDREDAAFKPTSFRLKSLGSTTPKVRGIHVLQFVNAAPLTVTNLLSGENETSILVVGDGQTTMQNNSNIVNILGADLLLVSNVIYKYLLLDGVWRQY